MGSVLGFCLLVGAIYIVVARRERRSAGLALQENIGRSELQGSEGRLGILLAEKRWRKDGKGVYRHDDGAGSLELSTSPGELDAGSTAKHELP